MIEDNNFGAELLNKIKDEKVALKPRWRFLAKNYLVWGLGAISLVLGATSMSLIIYMLANDDMAGCGRMGGRLWEKIVLSLPLFWIACLLLLALVVLYDVKHTKRGYRYSPLLIIAGIAVFSIILGGLFHLAGVGKLIDSELGRRAPFYDRVINPRIGFWSDPAAGRLIGVIEEQSGEYEYILIDRDRNSWKILTEDAEIASDVVFGIDLPIRLLGEVLTENVFQATAVFSMMPPGREFFDRFGPAPLKPGMFNGNRIPRPAN